MTGGEHQFSLYWIQREAYSRGNTKGYHLLDDIYFQGENVLYSTWCGDGFVMHDKDPVVERPIGSVMGADVPHCNDCGIAYLDWWDHLSQDFRDSCLRG